MTVGEATLKETEAGLVPDGEGWFVLNARAAAWWRSDELGQATTFEGRPGFADLGCHVEVLFPGQPNCMYHGESNQEDFLILSGECIVVVEGQERRLKAWDFVHCPPWTEHVFVGAGEGPCVIVMVGRRKRPTELLYPVDETAAKHGASVLEETRDGDEAYARFTDPERTSYQPGWLPGDSP
ncbi:MAG TPA: cupin domain-containing protein [Gaiellaceae bacterium]|nr:cupin domain-containing protein [Gaiellaceae bacterium]